MSADLAAAFPLGSKVRLEALSVDPYPILAELRVREPMSWVPETGMWFVTRRDDIMDVLRDPDTFTTDAPSTIRDMFGSHMMTTEGPVQIRYKRKCLPPFHASRLDGEERDRLEEDVDDLFASMSRAPGTAELRAGLTRPLALRSVMRVLGLPLAELDRVNGWYEHFARALANFTGDSRVRGEGKAAAANFADTITPILAELAQDPDGSLLADLVCDHIDPLTRQEITSNALIILFGGIETTDSMIANAIWALLHHPAELARVTAGEVALPAAIEESLRWDAAVQSAVRHTTRPTRLRGVDLKAGEAVQCMLGAANRDPAHFADPDRFDVGRTNASDHLSFAVGRHFCLGAPLARLETQVVLRRLLDECPGLELHPDHPSAPRGYEFRKPETLNVRWTSR